MMNSIRIDEMCMDAFILQVVNFVAKFHEFDC